jgi:site-specific DNA-cytosine methylase
LSGLGNGGPDDNDAQAGRLIVADTVRSHPRPGSNSNGQIVVTAPLTSGGHPNSNTPGRRKEDDENLVVARALTSSNERQDASVETMVVANTLKSQRGKGGGGVGPEETFVTHGFNLGRGGNSDLCLEEENQPPITGSHGNPGGVLVGLSVRRLTPTECERCQSLPDGWTQLGDTKDSKRYSALGDAVTANVAEWIGLRLEAV